MQNDRSRLDSEYRHTGKTGRSNVLSISASSIAEKVRSQIPSGPNKYDRNEKIDEVYRNWLQSSQHFHHVEYDQVLFLFYDLYKPRILAIAKNYRNLSPVFDDDDLLQTGLLGILQALVKYDHAEHIAMKFSTYLEWSIRSVFQRAIGYNDRFVEIYNGNGQFERTMNYQEFLIEKKELLSRGRTYTVKSRQCYLSDERIEIHSSASASLPPAERADDDRTPGDDHT